MAETMKAIVFSGVRGDPLSVLSLVTIPKPKPGKGQVLVRVLLSPIHPSTLAGISPGVYPGPGKDEPAGGEAVGVIEEHGEGCEGAPPKGTRVLILQSWGSWAEYIVRSSVGLVAVPDAVASYNAAQFYANPFSAYLMVKEYLKPQQGEWILQTAAGSALGRIVIQLGKILGYKTINVIRNNTYKDELLQLGGDEVIVTDTENLVERIKAITGGAGVKHALDCVGGEGTSAILKSMAYGGKVVIFGQLDNADIHFPSGLLVVKLLTIQGFWLSDWLKTAPLQDKIACTGEVMNLFATGKLDCKIREYDMKDFVEAIKASKAQGSTGKVMLKFSEL